MPVLRRRSLISISKRHPVLPGRVGAAAVHLDVGDTGMVQAIVAQRGPFDIVVNNAGVDQHAFFTDTTP